MFEVPGSDIVNVTVTKEAVLGEALPQYTYGADTADAYIEAKPLKQSVQDHKAFQEL